MKKDQTIQKELNRIAALNGGLLKPEMVVMEARSTKSPLHHKFIWDDTKAAHEHRLWQARKLIRVVVNVIESSNSEQRVWVNLRNENVGYRSLVSVLSDTDLRYQLLSQALDDMEYFTQKYERLEELSEVFESMKKVRSRHTHKSTVRSVA